MRPGENNAIPAAQRRAALAKVIALFVAAGRRPPRQTEIARTFGMSQAAVSRALARIRNTDNIPRVPRYPQGWAMPAARGVVLIEGRPKEMRLPT